MIPILYERTETSFTSNGLGRLRDAISAVVSEERNGLYELSFEYPVTGAHYNEITLGRIVGATHDDSNDIQPFDIVSFEKPIDGIVTFHCTHISYRQSYMTVRGKNINSLAAAFNLLKNNATPSNPFTYETDMVKAGYMGAADNIPRTVRSMLGGVEGSILDTYGGEYEWDKFNVILHSARGKQRDFTIRYGVNMLDFNDETDISGTYSSVIPYWTDGTKVIVGAKQTASGVTVMNRDECIPLDVSDKFEDKPTKAQVEAMASSMIRNESPYLPVQTIKVSFVRLQDTSEYANLGALLRCSLCDTIRVIFPDYNSSGYFKIVKTDWNVLENRYEEMELGTLSTTLPEALGIDEFGSRENRYSEISDIDKITVASRTSAVIDLANSDKVLLVGIAGGNGANAKMLALVNCTTNGLVTNTKISGTGTDITLTNGTNIITIANGSSYSMEVLIIRF